jgi:hypothetical protein
VFFSGAACFFVKHVQTGMCINVTGLIQTPSETWGTLSFVGLSNNCLDPTVQFRFLDNSAMLNLKRNSCFEATSRGGNGFLIPMLYFLLATNPASNCRDKEHAITQTSWGGLSIFYYPDKGTRCAVPTTDIRIKTQRIDPYIGVTIDCTDAEDKRFNFGKFL